MKTKIIILFILLITGFGYAQQGINYKAILKDDNGNVLANTFMNVQFTIHESTETGTIVYQEDHNYTTDANGVLVLVLGTDTTPSVGVFETIDWRSNQHFLQPTIAYSGGTINFDATEFMAVPYAKHAQVAEEIVKLPEPYILGRSTQTSNGRFQFNGKYGWQAAQDMCEFSYPNDPNVRAFTLEQIAQALVLGNWDTNNLNLINGISFWAITPISYTTTNTVYPTVQQNNLYGLNLNGTGTSVGTSGQIIIDATNIPGESNSDNPFNTYLRVTNSVASGFTYPCMCGTYN